MDHPLFARRSLVAVAAALLLIGAGCQDAPPPPPPPPPPEAQFDVTTTTCPEIAAARARVNAAYAASIQAASDRFWEARNAFQADLQECLDGLWNGGPCDEEWEASQQAYDNAWSDISNDQFYNEWKEAKKAHDDCVADFDARWEEFARRNQDRERLCQEEFQAKVDAANAAHDAAVDAARTKRDADMAFLDDLERRCRQQETGGGTGTTGGTGGTTTGGAGGTTTGTTGGSDIRPNAAACQDYVPGESGTPRQGRASDFGPRDVIINVATYVAEDITKAPLPTGAINDQIFAGMICVRIRTRLVEMEHEWIDAMGDNRAQRQIEQRQARYRRALSVWCAIAEGRQSVAQVQSEANAINAMPGGGCASDADCGQPVCCSNNEIGRMRCDTASGACRPERSACDDPRVCRGTPAACVAPPVMTQAIRVGNRYITLDQVHRFSGDECDDEEHWHANSGSARATDGTVMPDTSECGYGKTKDVPVVDVEVPAAGIEVRGLEGLRTR
jgi:hypothetical protein